MTSTKPNPNLIKMHRNYTFEELAEVLTVHKNTVSNWVKDGLPCLKDKRPFLILGHDAKEFIKAKNAKRKQTCKPNELFCLRCRKPSKPFDNFIEYSVISDTKGCLTGVCSTCECTINKFISAKDLDEYQRIFKITLPLDKKHINDSHTPALNCALNKQEKHT